VPGVPDGPVLANSDDDSATWVQLGWLGEGEPFDGDALPAEEAEVDDGVVAVADGADACAVVAVLEFEGGQEATAIPAPVAKLPQKVTVVP